MLLDVTERAKIALEVQRKMLNDYYPLAHITHPVGLMAAWNDVRGYVPPIGLTNRNQYWDVWIAK